MLLTIFLRDFLPLFSPRSYDPRMLIDETLAVFIAATTGQGVEPDNMRRFWRFLMRKYVLAPALPCTACSLPLALPLPLDPSRETWNCLAIFLKGLPAGATRVYAQVHEPAHTPHACTLRR